MTPERGPRPDGYRSREAKDRQLGVAEEFKKFIAENPGVLKKFFELSRKLEVRGDLGEEGDFKVELVESYDVDPDEGEIEKVTKVSYYKVSSGNTEFFVKEAAASYHSGGFAEVESSRKLKKFLEDEKIAGVEVVDFQAGYTDKDRKVFVSKWNEALKVGLDEYLEDLDPELERLHDKGEWEQYRQLRAKRDDLRKRFEKLRLMLEGDYRDFYENNISYDEERDVLIIIDVGSVEVTDAEESE